MRVLNLGQRVLEQILLSTKPYCWPHEKKSLAVTLTFSSLAVVLSLGRVAPLCRLCCDVALLLLLLNSSTMNVEL